MSMRIEAYDLTGTGLTDQEVRTILSSISEEEQIRLLRRGRGRLLEDIHKNQQALDRLDYFIYQIKMRKDE